MGRNATRAECRWIFVLSKGFGSATSSTDLAHWTSLSRAAHVRSGVAWRNLVGPTRNKTSENMWEVQKELVILEISWYSLISLHRTRGNDVSPAAHGLIWSYLALDYWQNVWRFGCTLLFIASIPSDSPIQVVRVFDSVESVESEAEPGSFLWRLVLGDANSAVGVWDAVRLQGLSNSGCEAHMRWMCLHV